MISSPTPRCAREKLWKGVETVSRASGGVGAQLPHPRLISAYRRLNKLEARLVYGNMFHHPCAPWIATNPWRARTWAISTWQHFLGLSLIFEHFLLESIEKKTYREGHVSSKCSGARTQMGGASPDTVCWAGPKPEWPSYLTRTKAAAQKWVDLRCSWINIF